MAKQDLARTGYTASTPQNYLLDAGAVYRNLRYTALEGWTGELLGATSGGSTLTIEPTYRTIEVDGPKIASKGGRALEDATASLEANVKEITVENYRRAINGKIRDAEAEEAPTGYKVIETSMTIGEEMYDENVAYVGTLSGSDQPFIAILENPFVTSAAETSFEDNGEAVLPITFEASADENNVNENRLPWQIFFPPLREDAAEASTLSAGEADLNPRVLDAKADGKDTEPKSTTKATTDADKK